ncbi:MAG: serine hydrolase domain-containing protein, partial [Bryobacteraceae bacterium]
MKLHVLAVWMAASAAAQTLSASADLDAAIDEAVRAGQVPGAVLVVGQRDRIVHRKAYGNRALRPMVEPMTVDTIFDCASLTKVVATTSAVMKLVEQGKVRLGAPVTEYLPEFQAGKSAITVRHLLTHFSGLRPDVDLEPEWKGYETGVRLALVDRPRTAPGERFTYSDINFILLGEIVRKLSGRTLPDFVRSTVLEPLGMRDTMFQPPASLRGRIAPTEDDLRGVVHD